jgi:putative nucleotidyltransferase with HDIG domain
VISKEEALHLVEGTRKRQHALIASAIMRKLAQRLGEDEERWEIVGLLHDLDYDMVQEDMTKHGVVAGEILAKKLNSESLYAIKSHDYRTGFKPKGKMDIALIVADTLAVIVARMATSRELSVQRIEEEIERLLIEKPWYKANLRKAGELGLERSEVLLLGMESMRSISGS